MSAFYVTNVFTLSPMFTYVHSDFFCISKYFMMPKKIFLLHCLLKFLKLYHNRPLIYLEFIFVYVIK